MKADWLIERVSERIERMSMGPFFQYLGAVRDRSGLSWVHQLAHMSVGVIQALLLRAAVCGRRSSSDLSFLTCFLAHASAECMHPPDLECWARLFDLVGAPGTPEFCGVEKTPETDRLLDHLWMIAEKGTPEEQVVVLNMVTEGVALAFYRSALVTLRSLDMNVGRYWMAHEEADADHARMGVDRLDIEDQYSELSVRLAGLAFVTLDLFEAALTSWVPPDVAVVGAAGRPTLSSFAAVAS